MFSTSNQLFWVHGGSRCIYRIYVYLYYIYTYVCVCIIYIYVATFFSQSVIFFSAHPVTGWGGIFRKRKNRWAVHWGVTCLPSEFQLDTKHWAMLGHIQFFLVKIYSVESGGKDFSGALRDYLDALCGGTIRSYELSFPTTWSRCSFKHRVVFFPGWNERVSHDVVWCSGEIEMLPPCGKICHTRSIWA